MKVLSGLTAHSRAFTIFWVFPVSSFVALVNIQNLSTLWPGLVRPLMHAILLSH